MTSDSVGADSAAHQRLLHSLGAALRSGALPGELEGFDDAETQAAAEFVLACAERRPSGFALVRLESVGGQVGQRRMRIVIVNDDMPFLVDSVAASVAQFGLVIHRLLHPVSDVVRDAEGSLIGFGDGAGGGAVRESIIYMEVDRADARAA